MGQSPSRRVNGGGQSYWRTCGMVGIPHATLLGLRQFLGLVSSLWGTTCPEGIGR